MDSQVYNQAVARLRETLLADGWRLRRCRNGVRVKWRWLSVTLKLKAGKNPGAPWRARLRDGFPRVTIAEHWRQDPLEALEIVIAHARRVKEFTEGQLVRNPSKSYLSHRLWQAVRPATKDA